MSTSTTARPAARTAPVDRALADVHLPGWDHADSYEVTRAGARPVDALSAAHCLLHPSRPGRQLLRARDLVVKAARLEPSVRGNPGGALFPVLHATDDLAVLGMDDRHLDFRVLVALTEDAVRCTSVVRRHNALGKGYFAVVRPFHLMLVPRLLTHAARRDWRRR